MPVGPRRNGRNASGILGFCGQELDGTMRIETMPTPGIVAGRVRNGVIIWLLPMVAIAVLGAARLAYPFHGDQALFMLGARTLAGGGTLYVDFWDCKQPGIYLLYLLAGRFFGFDEIGVHLFELVWNLGWAAAVISTTRSWFTRDWLRVRFESHEARPRRRTRSMTEAA
jgi:hypothetical protein